jgi:hypothetical protein
MNWTSYFSVSQDRDVFTVASDYQLAKLLQQNIVFFRLENEHLNNCGDFRAVRNISIAPLSNNIDYALIEYKLAKEPGIRNRPRTVPCAMMIYEEKMMTTNNITVFGNNPTFTCDITLVLDVNEINAITRPMGFINHCSLLSLGDSNSPYPILRIGNLNKLLKHSKSV